MATSNDNFKTFNEALDDLMRPYKLPCGKRFKTAQEANEYIEEYCNTELYKTLYGEIEPFEIHPNEIFVNGLGNGGV